MSHQPERKEKNCLNCGAILVGRYCHVCGQENIIPKQNFWSLCKHFVFDIFHFDGKFFDTLKYLFTKPAYVAKQYVHGKRMSYLDPIRMYLFTSAIFFLIFFTFDLKVNLNSVQPLTYKQRQEKISNYRDQLKNHPADSVKYLRRIRLLEDTSHPVSYATLYKGEATTYKVNDREYKTAAQYDSVQKALPKEQQDGWLTRIISRRVLVMLIKYNGNSDEIGKVLLEGFFHRLPYLLFISLPIFALLLKLLYIRKKQFYYSDHAVFTLYHYIFSFILLLIIFGVNALSNWLDWSILDYFMIALLLVWPVYLFIEMKRFYMQGTGKTLVKFLLLNIIGVILLFLLIILLFVFSLYQT